ncbi:MAG: calcineurin-like phosphoesterase family protein [Armatimonadetes bacterium]|nr:calcineurin-like phosphoesterase family protein [Armatimonadota bacterium]
MRKIHLILCLVSFVLAGGYDPAGAESRTATGFVYEDANKNRTRDPGEKGLAGVHVSNGKEVVKTDAAGRYRLPVSEDTILFVVKPRGWQSPLSAQNLPQFYYIHKPGGSPKMKFPGAAPTGPLPASVDFPLCPKKEPNRFRVVLFGDTQTGSQEDVDYLAHDIVEELIGVEAAFGVTLGDLAHEAPPLWEPLAKTVGLIGIPWHNVLGNHDMNFDYPDDNLSDESFERVFGPSYYAYDYGPVHFVILNDVDSQGEGRYRGGIGAAQLEFLKNDLALTPKGQLVVLMMHIPIMQTAEKEAIYRLLAARPHTFSISAHRHTQAHHFLGKKDGWPGVRPHHHLVHATACGGWWTGAPDETGIPHATMSDGAPNGYSIVTFDRTRYAVEFKAARRPAHYQMNLYAPEEVAAGETGKTEVAVNVFAGSERSKVEMRLGDQGPWAIMQPITRQDPYFVAIKKAEAGPNPPAGRKLPGASDTSHIWRAFLPAGAPAGTHLIHVRTTDMFGHTYTARRAIRVR